MLPIFAALQDHPVQHYAAGDLLISQGDSTGHFYILIDGALEVIKDGVTVAKSSEPGAIFGELSALLGVPHTAEVRVVRDSTFHVVADPGEFLERNPLVSLHLSKLLARRLDAVNKYLVDVKRQFTGHDHLAILDGMLDTLMHRQPRERILPKASTLRDPEIAD